MHPRTFCDTLCTNSHEATTLGNRHVYTHLYLLHGP